MHHIRVCLPCAYASAMYSDQSHACSYDTCSSILVDQCLFFIVVFLGCFCVVHPKASQSVAKFPL